MNHSVNRPLLLILCTLFLPGLWAQAPSGAAESQKSGLKFLSPREGQIIAGNHSLLWVAETNPAT